MREQREKKEIEDNRNYKTKWHNKNNQYLFMQIKVLEAMARTLYTLSPLVLTMS